MGANHTQTIGFLTVEQIAQVMKLTPATIRNLIKDGELPANKIGRQYRINYDDFINYLYSTATARDPESMQNLESTVRAVISETENDG